MKLINQVNQDLLTIFRTVINQPRLKEDPVLGQGTADAISDLLLMNSLLAVMTDHGRPVELVFFSEKGDKINLLDEKPLSQDELINIFLDNLKNNQNESEPTIKS
ncbi:MAG: hypothetical protein AB7U05_17210 [Mangrovibacterium sp.]